MTEDFEAEYEEDFEEAYDDDAISQILKEAFDALPSNVISMLNLPRYAKAKQSIETIFSIILEEQPDAKLSVHYDEILGTSLLASAEIKEFLPIRDIAKWNEAMESVSIMDIEAMIDESFRISFAYDDVKIALHE